MKKITVLLLVVVLTIGIIPVVGLASGEKATESETSEEPAVSVMDTKTPDVNKETYDFEGVTYKDIYYGKSRNELEKADAKSIRDMFKDVLMAQVNGKNQIETVWVPVAENAIKNNDAYQVRWASNPRNFEDAFENGKYTCVTVNGDKKDIATEWPKENHLHYVTSFDQLKQDITDNMESNSYWIQNGLSEGIDAYKKELKFPDSKDRYAYPEYSGDIFYSMFSNVTQYGAHVGKGNGGCIFNTFIIAYYDFQITPLDDVYCALENYQNEDMPAEAAVKAGEKDVTFKAVDPETKDTVLLNDTASDMEFKASRGTSDTTTVENSMSVTTQKTFHQGVSINYTFSTGAATAAFARHSVDVGADFTFEEMYNNTETTTNSKSHTSGETTEVTVKLPPSTQAIASVGTSKIEATAKYTCPVYYTYKVAIIAVSGDYSGSLPNTHVRQKFNGCVASFGTGETDKGNAIADLKTRRADSTYEKQGINWDDLKQINTAMLWTAASHFGGTMKYEIDSNMAKVSEISPIYPLNETQVDVKEYTIFADPDPDSRVNDENDDISDEQSVDNQYRLNLSDIEVTGLSKTPKGTNVNYYGFGKDQGTWGFCDKNGDDIDKSTIKCAKIVRSQNCYFLQGLSEGTVYLRYNINKKTFPVDPTDIDKGYLDSLKTNAVISVDVVAEAFDGRLEAYAPEGGIVMHLQDDPKTGGKISSLHLCDVEGLDCAAYDKNGKRINGGVSFHWQNAGTGDGFSVDDDGMATATKPGTYQIQAYCGKVVSNTLDVQVLEADAALVIVLTDHATENPSLQKLGELLKNNKFSLDDYQTLSIDIYDAYGDDLCLWCEDFEELEESAELGWTYDNIYGEQSGMVIEDGQILRADPGIYRIYAIYHGVKSNGIDVVVQ